MQYASTSETYGTYTGDRVIGTVYASSDGRMYIVYDGSYYSSSASRDAEVCQAIKQIEEERPKEEPPLEVEKPYEHRPIAIRNEPPSAPVARRSLRNEKGRCTFK